MRILVLQLARFGDIYQTWPTLKALQRARPSAEIHVLVRARFAAALEGMTGVQTHLWPTQEILRPILESDDETLALDAFQRVVKPLVDLQFDSIINLSFSPFASFLTDLLTTSASEVRGYTRHADGHLHIPDDTSAYFYAQTGIARANRYHVTELFAAVAGVDLMDEDHYVEAPRARSERHGVIVHLGASQEIKTYPPELWVKAIAQLLRECSEDITLVGSDGERAMAETVAEQLNSPRVHNRVGESTLPQLMEWIGGAKLLLGADSAPVHMASLSDTPVLNLSSDQVNFWETGPRSAQSRILYKKDLSNIAPERVATEAAALLRGSPPTGPCVLRPELNSAYALQEMTIDDFAWRLIEALYTGTPYPDCETKEDALAFQRLFELSELALHQLARWSDEKSRPVAAGILAQVDEILPEIARLNPRVEPVVQWFETQRLRIPPGAASETLQQTQKAFEDLHLVSAVYHRFLDPAHEMRRALALCRECTPELRDYNFKAVEAPIQTLVTVLHELSRHSTKVGEETWSSVLSEFDQSLQSGDFIGLADFLEWKLVPTLTTRLTEKETSAPDVLS